MIVYKIDQTTSTDANAQIRDMATVLAEIPATLDTLQALIDRQEAAFSTPSFNDFRRQLRTRVEQAIDQTRVIAEHSQKLANVSDEAGKHLMTIENHFGAALQNASQIA